MIIDRYRWLWALLVPAFVAAISLAAAVLVSVRAAAHDFYPAECCGGHDCGPVEHVEFIAGASYATALGPGKSAPPVMIVTTKDGSAPVPPDLPRQVSQDNRMHACLRKVWALGKDFMEVRCIFLPPTN